jgi:hypothetical protein
MRAVQFAATGPASAMRCVAGLPTPQPGPQEVCVRVAYAGVNFIDCYHRSGLYPVSLPYVPGREGAGTIHALGADVATTFPHLRVGQRVAFLSTHAYAEYAPAEARFVMPLPDGLSLEVGAGMLIQGITTLSLMRKACPIKAGDTVLVHAAAGGSIWCWPSIWRERVLGVSHSSLLLTPAGAHTLAKTRARWRIHTRRRLRAVAVPAVQAGGRARHRDDQLAGKGGPGPCRGCR